MEFSLSNHLILSHSQFMGVPPARRISQQQLRYHYDVSMVLVHFLIANSEASRRLLQRSLTEYREQRATTLLTWPKNTQLPAAETCRHLFQETVEKKGDCTPLGRKEQQSGNETKAPTLLDQMIQFYQGKGLRVKEAKR